MYVFFFCFYNECILYSFIRIYYCNKSLISNINSSNYLFFLNIIAPVVIKIYWEKSMFSE